MYLDLQFCEGTGTTTQDWSKLHMGPNTLTGVPAWTDGRNDLTYLDFDIGPPREYIITLAADSGALNFTSASFSGMAWYYPESGGNRYMFNKGTNVTGWCFYLNASNRMSFGTRQAAASQYTSGDVLTLNAWHLVGFSRSGASVQIYTNGRDTTSTAATHVNSDSAAAQNFYIGCTDAVGAGWMNGLIWRPRIIGRATTAAEHLAVFEAERHLLEI